MIKCVRETVEIEGTGAEILSELAGAIEAIYEAISKDKGEKFAKEMIDKAYKLALSSEEELRKEAEESVKKTISLLEKFIER